MNRYAKALGMENTFFTNSRGLDNKSTAAEIGKLSCMAMADPLMREICSTLRHECEGKDP